MHRLALAPMLVFLLGACSTPSLPSDDASNDAPSSRCASNAECDDHLFCDGVETCVSGTADADARGCRSGAPPCTGSQTCDEAMDACTSGTCPVRDADHDGEPSPACGGTDCDDTDPTRYPTNVESCDAMAHDEDCDPTTFGMLDADADGYADATCCNVEASGARHCGNDCNDGAIGVHPDAPEVCDRIDEDCDGSADEGVLIQYYADCDGDGHGTATPTCSTAPMTTACSRPSGYSEDMIDCDDSPSPGQGALRFPGRTEVCDGIDNDCNTLVDDGLPVHTICSDLDGDGWAATPCLPGCGAGLHQIDVTANSFRDPVMYPATRDCNDMDPTINPGAMDACGINRNCDGATDPFGTIVYYVDCDGDDFAASSAGSLSTCTAPTTPPSCTIPSGACMPTTLAARWTTREPVGTSATDCDDYQSHVFPGSTYDLCVAPDVNCDGAVDPIHDVDADGYSTCGCNLDCNDARMMGESIHPGAVEALADGVDQDCDGMEICYVDADGDRDRTDATTTTTDIACTQSLGHDLATNTSIDCCDADPSAYHFTSSLLFHTTEDACMSYDYNCDSTDTPRYTLISSQQCSPVLSPMHEVIGCRGASDLRGWLGAVPACGEAAGYAVGTCALVIDPDTGADMCLPNLESRTQSCQ